MQFVLPMALGPGEIDLVMIANGMQSGANDNPPFQCFFDKNGRFRSIEWL